MPAARYAGFAGVPVVITRLKPGAISSGRLTAAFPSPVPRGVSTAPFGQRFPTAPFGQPLPATPPDKHAFRRACGRRQAAGGTGTRVSPAHGGDEPA
jgi:hypothetical protein